jgi:hypothetical protein
MTASPQTTWLSEQRVDGKLAARIGRRGEDLVAEFPNAGTFVASARGRKIHVEPVAGGNPAALEKLALSLFDAFARHLQGKATLHGGAAGLKNSAIALVGPSGAGKSTLTSALCTSGLDLVADDTVATEIPVSSCNAPVQVIPTQTTAWLLPSSRLALGLEPGISGKAAVTLRPTTAPVLGLIAIVGLVFDPVRVQPAIRRLRGQDAFSLLAKSVIRFVIDDPNAQLHEFDQLKILAMKCPIFELRRPRDLAQLQKSAELIKGLLAESGRMEERC